MQKYKGFDPVDSKLGGSPQVTEDVSYGTLCICCDSRQSKAVPVRYDYLLPEPRHYMLHLGEQSLLVLGHPLGLLWPTGQRVEGQASIITQALQNKVYMCLARLFVIRSYLRRNHFELALISPVQAYSFRKTTSHFPPQRLFMTRCQLFTRRRECSKHLRLSMRHQSRQWWVAGST